MTRHKQLTCMHCSWSLVWDDETGIYVDVYGNEYCPAIGAELHTIGAKA